MKQILITIAAVLLAGCIGVTTTGLLKDKEGNLIILPVEPIEELKAEEK